MVNVKIIRDMYDETGMSVNSVCRNGSIYGDTRCLQGLAFSPYLLSLVMDELTKGVQDEAPRCIMFVNDVV